MGGMIETYPLLMALAVGYGLGSLPFGLLLTRVFGYGDIRKMGSGNIGTTNVLRTAGKGLAAATLLLDMLKGTLAIWLVASQTDQSAAIALAGFAAFLGHLYPVWLAFRGGKGVATFLGCLIALDFSAALLFSMLWLVVAALSRYSSLSALVGTILTTFFVFYSHGLDWTGIVVAVMALLLILRHHSNIKRLFSGTESRIRK